jgi:hypothetical protein
MRTLQSTTPLHRRKFWCQFVVLLSAGLAQRSVSSAADSSVPLPYGDASTALVAANSLETQPRLAAADASGDGQNSWQSPVRLHSAYRQAKPESLQFPAWDSTRAVPRTSLFNEVLSDAANPLPTKKRRLTAATPAATTAVSRLAFPADATARPSTLSLPASSTQGSASGDTRSEAIKPRVAPISKVPLIPAVPRLTQTTMLKLDTLQAGCFGTGLLLCLVFQVAIVIVLLRQRNALPAQIAQYLPVFDRALHGGNPFAPIAGGAADRNTAVADFMSDPGLLEGAASSIGSKWKQEEDTLRQQEAAIIEELVTKNVDWARELA